MERKYNILFLASWYPNKTSPQAGNFIQQHARCVAAYCNVFALHIAPRIQDKKFTIETNTVNNVEETIVYYKKVTSTFLVLSQIQKIILRKKAHLLGFQSIIKRHQKIDLTHLNVCFPAGTFALYLKRKHKIPYIVSENWTVLLDSDPTEFNFVENYYVNSINRNAAMLCPVSEDLKKALVKIAPNQKFKIIPNIVDTSVFKFTGINKTRPINILHVSTLKEEHKNISGIIRVIKRLSEVRSDFKITIAGNGDYENWQKYAQSIGVPVANIEIMGKKSSIEVAQLMTKSNLFLLFSNYENLPCVIVESLAMGLPVISTNVGGVPEMLDTSNGVLLKPKDEDNLYKILNEQLSNLDFYDNTTISNNAINKYSYEKVAQQFLGVYKQIIN